MVISHEGTTIGENTKFGPNVCVYDHDYDFRNRERYLKGMHVCSPITIGKNCWIGAGTIILRGTHIGDNCVIGAGCVIKGNYESGQLIVQKREDLLRPLKQE